MGMESRMTAIPSTRAATAISISNNSTFHLNGDAILSSDAVLLTSGGDRTEWSADLRADYTGSRLRLYGRVRLSHGWEVPVPTE